MVSLRLKGLRLNDNENENDNQNEKGRVPGGESGLFFVLGARMARKMR